MADRNSQRGLRTFAVRRDRERATASEKAAVVGLKHVLR